MKNRFNKKEKAKDTMDPIKGKNKTHKKIEPTIKTFLFGLLHLK